jgi:transposase
LTDDTARAAMAALAAGDTVKAVADRFGVSIWCIYDLRLGRTFKHLARGGAKEPAGAYQPP